jgi:HAD superfamily hydrolase (TIGR01509 family)
MTVRNTQPTAILWDNDGVLVDTEALYFQATRELLASVGATLSEALYIELFLREGRGAWHLARELGETEERIAELTRLRNARYAELLLQGNWVYPGVADAIRVLGARYRMAIVTSSEREHFEVIHRASELLPHFELVLTRRDYVHSKPDPEPYLTALQRMRVTADDCLVIEDSERGLRAALAAGIRCWMIRSPFTRTLDFPGAERVFDDIASLAAALL